MPIKAPIAQAGEEAAFNRAVFFFFSWGLEIVKFISKNSYFGWV
jgi:hypothetical protein